MRDLADFLGVVEALVVGSTNVTLMALGIHAEARREVQASVECLPRTGTKGHARTGVFQVFLARDVDKRLDLGDDLLPFGIDPRVDVLQKLGICHSGSLQRSQRSNTLTVPERIQF